MIFPEALLALSTRNPSLIKHRGHFFACKLLILVCLAISSCEDSQHQVSTESAAPEAPVKPTILSLHGVDRVDDYYWIRDDTRSDPEMLDLLRQENAYTSVMMQHTGELQDRLFNEIAQRLADNKKTVPVKKGNFEYHQEYREGTQYPIYLRRQLPPGHQQEAEVILDVNKLAKGHEYFSVDNWSVSPDEQKMAYVEDSVSRRQYTLRIKNLETGDLLEDRIQNVSTSIAWSGDSKYLFYVSKP